MKITGDALTRAQKIKAVVFDVDGTLSDGKIYMGMNGELAKAFNCRDGMGISLAHKAGLKTAIITGRTSEIVANRAAELKMSGVWQGVSDKRVAFAELKEKFGVSDEEVAYVGDDLNDLPLLNIVGLPCVVGDAVMEVKAVAKLEAGAAGGNGAVREILEYIMKSQGSWDKAVASFVSPEPIEKLAQ